MLQVNEVGVEPQLVVGPPVDQVLEILLTPVGMTSETTTPREIDGPSLSTVMVHVTFSPALAGAGLAVLVARRSATVETVVDVLAVSVDGGHGPWCRRQPPAVPAGHEAPMKPKTRV